MSSNEELRTYPSVGNLIREGRLRKGLSYRKLAEATGLNFSYIYNIESGKRGVSPTVLDAMSQVLEMDRDELYAAARLWPPSFPPSRTTLQVLRDWYASQNNQRSTAGQGLTDVLITLRMPAYEKEGVSDRRSRYLQLVKAAYQSRDKFVEWLRTSGLRDEVVEMGEPSAFGVLSIKCSEQTASLLRNAPEVEAVAPADARIELIE